MSGPARKEKATFGSDFRRFFLRGLTVLMPSILTIWILWHAFVFVFKNCAEPINALLRAGVVAAMPLAPESYHPQWYTDPTKQMPLPDARPATPAPRAAATPDLTQQRRQALKQYWQSRWYLQATGLIVAIVLIYLAGLLLGGLLGRQVYSRVERIIARVPGFKQVYPHVKQAVDLVLGDRQMAFSRVVAIQFPRPGSWAMGFVTGPAMRDAAAGTGKYCFSVFVPTTPTPFTGFTLTIPQDEIVDLPITIDEAIRYAITGGVLVPESQTQGRPPEAVAAAVTAAMEARRAAAALGPGRAATPG